MAQRRQITWPMAMRDLRRERTPASSVSPLLARSLARARSFDAVQIACRRALRTASGFDHSAIMLYALALARLERARGSLLPWRSIVSLALRTAWTRAKAVAIPPVQSLPLRSTHEARP